MSRSGVRHRMANEKPETRFISRVHRGLDRRVYREKTANPFRRGMPDVYYEGDAGILWAEYKWLPTVRNRFTPGLSELQRQWLIRAHRNGHTVAVIVGCPEGGVFLPGLRGLQEIRNPSWQSIESLRTELLRYTCHQEVPNDSDPTGATIRIVSAA